MHQLRLCVVCMMASVRCAVQYDVRLGSRPASAHRVMAPWILCLQLPVCPKSPVPHKEGEICHLLQYGLRGVYKRGCINLAFACVLCMCFCCCQAWHTSPMQVPPRAQHPRTLRLPHSLSCSQPVTTSLGCASSQCWTDAATQPTSTGGRQLTRRCAVWHLRLGFQMVAFWILHIQRFTRSRSSQCVLPYLPFYRWVPPVWPHTHYP